MRISRRPFICLLQVAALLFWIAPAESLADTSQGRLEGLVLDVEGRPASGHRVHLIDNRGREMGHSDVGEDGMYSFASLPEGDYSLGVASPDGTVAVVAAPPVRLQHRELARRDLKLVQADETAVNQAAEANYGFSLWWHGLSPLGKTWTVVAIVIAAGLTYEAVSDEDEGSRFVPNN